MPACPGPASVVLDPALLSYDFGPGHPMSPVRVDLTVQLARELGVVGDRLDVVTARPASYDELRAVHTAELLEAVAAGRPDERHGLGTPDDPVFAGMHDAAALVAGATVEACRQVWSGERLHSANVAGGLHHAMADRASGFCIYNDPAVGIAWLLAAGAERVAYVDVDAHHGDGVEAAFRDDPRVLTISLHESGQFLFPGTGSSDDVGGPGAEGFAVNVPLPPRTGDAGWLRAFHAVVPPLLREVRPQVLVTQHGCDSHRDDPLADLALSVDAQRAAALALHDLAHEVSDGRWVALGGGGYAVTTVVPRSWTHLLAAVAGRPLDPATPLPEAWRARVEELTGEPGPERMGDLEPGGESEGQPGFTPWEQGYDPADDLDRAVHATRTAVFPYHGLDPQAW